MPRSLEFRLVPSVLLLILGAVLAMGAMHWRPDDSGRYRFYRGERGVWFGLLLDSKTGDAWVYDKGYWNPVAKEPPPIEDPHAP